MEASQLAQISSAIRAEQTSRNRATAVPYVRDGGSYSRNPITRINSSGSNLSTVSNYNKYGTPNNPNQNQNLAPMDQAVLAAQRSANEAANAAIDQNVAFGQNSIGIGNNMFGNFKADFLKNGNPDYQGGIATIDKKSAMNMGAGQLKIPNAVAQQIAFFLSVNAGRASAKDFAALGGNDGTKDMPYFSYDSLQSQINKKMQANPNLATEGALDPVKRVQDQALALFRKSQTIQDKLASPIMEQRSAGGAYAGGTNVEALRQEAEALRRSGSELSSSIGNKRRGYGGLDNSIYDLLQYTKPTTSNLMFRETINS